MKKKMALLLAGMMVLSLVGCGESQSGQDVQEASQAEEGEDAVATQEEAGGGETEDSGENQTGQSSEENAGETDDQYYYVNGKAPEEVTGNILFWSWDPNFFDMVEKMNDIYPNVTFDFVTVRGRLYAETAGSAYQRKRGP